MLEWLRDCAEKGEPCPSNGAICSRYRYKSAASAANLLGALEVAGKITVERSRNARVVRITATGQTTARPPGFTITSNARETTDAAAARLRDTGRTLPAAKAPPAVCTKHLDPAPHAPFKPFIPAVILQAQREDGRELPEFCKELMLMGLECWRDDRHLEAVGAA